MLIWASRGNDLSKSTPLIKGLCRAPFTQPGSQGKPISLSARAGEGRRRSRPRVCSACFLCPAPPRSSFVTHSTPCRQDDRAERLLRGARCCGGATEARGDGVLPAGTCDSFCKRELGAGGDAQAGSWVRARRCHTRLALASVVGRYRARAPVSARPFLPSVISLPVKIIRPWTNEIPRLALKGLSSPDANALPRLHLCRARDLSEAALRAPPATLWVAPRICHPPAPGTADSHLVESLASLVRTVF